MTISHTKRFALLMAGYLLTPLSYADDYFDNMLAVIGPAHSQIAVAATDLNTGKVIYSHNADTLLLPASTQKLLTAVAATAQLGPEFSYRTKLTSRFLPRQGKISGDLYLSFSGDPTLTTDDLRALFKQLTDEGVYQIEGDLYLVGQRDEQTRAPGWVWDDLGICYAAPVSSYIINRNCVHGQLKPKLASSASILTFPSYLPIQITTSATFDKKAQQAFCELSLARLADNHFHLSGCHAGSTPLNLAIAINEPARYAQQMISNMLRSAQIKLKGKVKLTTQSPEGQTPLASHSSKQLNALLKVMLLDSDNLIADSLFKAVGGDYYDSAGTFTNGAAAMKSILSQAGVDLSHSQIIDGSGLSRYNLLSANQLSQVLMLIASDTRFNNLMALLPQSGVSGTLRYKTGFRTAPLKHKVRAKTGSMQGVDNLAGFFTVDTDHQALFVVMENGQSEKSRQDALSPFAALFLQSLLDSQVAQSITAEQNLKLQHQNAAPDDN